MKTAISIPDGTFEAAEMLAKKLRKSRSQLYSEAVAEYVARHDPESMTAEMDEVCSDVGDGVDPFVAEAARRTLERVKW